MNTVIVIGGSKGIGKALITKLLEHSKVMNISRTKPDLSSDNLSHFTCDVLQDELPDIEQADSLVYCPGSINLKPFSRLKTEDFQNDFDINVLGAVKALQKYLPLLKNGHHPSVVLFSTVAAKLGMPFHASIAAAKSAIEGLVKSLGAEWAPNIRINAIAPTVTDTGLASKILRNEKMIETIVERHPLKKFLIPEEVADMAEFLISKKAASLSGQIFEMDCGIVSFKITEKIKVKGKEKHALYKWLTDKSNNGVKNSSVKWNFQKYLIDPQGKLVDYFLPTISPLSAKITNHLK